MQLRDLTLADMMAALNADVFRSTEGSRYATLVHAVLTTATGHLRYVNAGHPAAIVVDADGPGGRPRRHGAGARPLRGARHFPPPRSRWLPGDTLVVVSDGVSEALDVAGREFDLAQYSGGRLGRRRRSDSWPAAIVDAVCRHRGVDQAQDDVTVLCVRRRP